MKRISTLLLSAAMLMGSVGVAQATDVKMSGTFEFAFGWVNNMKHFNGHRDKVGKDGENDRFMSRQRIRPQVNFIASEQLQGVLMFEIGTTEWGRNSQSGQPNSGDGIGGALDTDGVNIETKRAYLDWIIPDTDVAIRMGLQGLALPSATGFGNPVFDADVAAITASYKFDETFALTGFWARPFDYATFDSGTSDSSGRWNQRRVSDETDMFGLVLAITGDGWALTPWGVYSNVGTHSGAYEYLLGKDWNGENAIIAGSTTYPSRSVPAWWAGTGFEISMFDPLTFKADFMYGSLGRSDAMGMALNNLTDQSTGTSKQSFGMRGWFADAALDYKMDWATAGLFGWYGSGDSSSGVNKGVMGRMPVLGLDGGFHPTSFGTPGAEGCTADGLVLNGGVGTWGVGVKLADMSFIDDLTHTIRVAYYRGTNDAAVVKHGYKHGQVNVAVPLDGSALYLTDKDSAWEINFDHKYQIYENLAAFVELGYIHLDMNDNVWNNTKGSNFGKSNNAYETSDAWKAQVLFKYTF